MDMSGASISTRILVIGAGRTGLTAAREIADFGFSVLLVPGCDQEDDEEARGLFGHAFPVNEEGQNDADAELRQRESLRFLPGARLTGCRGTLGNFKLRLESGEEILEETAGAVVLACEMRSVPLFASYGLSEARNAISLSRLEEMLTSQKSEENGASLLGPAEQIAFLSGFAREGDPVSQRRILNSLRALDEQGYRTSIYTRDLKVADDGLVELAKTDRQLGTIFFKLDECPDISPDGGEIRHNDPVLEREVRIHPDLIVLEERFLPGPENERLARILNITTNEDGFLQDENIHRLPVRTNRMGVFAVGAARGIMTPGQTRSDAANAALALQEEFQSLQRNLFGTRAFIDEDKCCVCLTCYRLCPHGAISLEQRPVISSLACQGCGLCASQCPQEAISVLDSRLEDIGHSGSERIHAPKNAGQPPRIVAYCCRNSAYEAGMAAYAFNRDLPSGLIVVDVPCAGTINRDMILSSLKKGADGLLILGCHFGACKSTWGNAFACHQSDRLGSILEEVGLSRERIRFRTLAENMDAEFSAFTREMEESLVHLGRNPLA